MPKLLLIKHAKPLVDPTKSSELWKLSDEGRDQARLLVQQLSSYQPSLIVFSDEPKASETAAIVGTELNIPTEPHKDLHEHDRHNVPHMRSGEFISHVELFFRKPHELVLGHETAQQALDRFEDAIDDILKKHPDSNVAVVSHGTVIALFIEKHSNHNGFQVWREMSLPSFAVFDLPGKRLGELRNKL
jgi:broad specificity phosphatase PhoE